MANNGKVRALIKTDLAMFKCIRLESLQREPEAFASHYDDWIALDDDAWLERLTDGHAHGAFVDDEIVGLIGLLPAQPQKMRHRGSIVMVYLRADQRGTGLARTLLNTIIAKARGLGLTQLELSVSAENPAGIRFYEREGFTIYGRLSNGVIESDGRSVDDILMMRSL